MESSSDQVNDQELVAMLRKQDSQGMSLIYDKYSAALYGVVLKIVRSEEAAQDVLQEAFLKIWKNGATYDDTKGRLFTWMLNITRNTAIDALRSRPFRNQEKTQSIDNNVYSNIQLSTETQVNHIGLQSVLDKLDEKYRKIIDLIYFEGYTQQEIEDEFEIPIGTVKTRVRIALRELRKLLGEEHLLTLLWILIIIGLHQIHA